MKKIFYFLLAMIFAIQGWSQDTVTIGNGTTGSYELPVNFYYSYSYSQQIYTATEIGPQTGVITHIGFEYMHSSPSTRNNIRIFIGNTNESVFASSSSWLPTSSMQEVFFGNISFQNGWVYIPLDNYYQWDNVSNLVICVIDGHGQWDNSESHFYVHTQTGNVTLRTQTDSSPYSSTTSPSSGTTSTSRNNIKFIFSTPPTCPKPTALTASNPTTTGFDLGWTDATGSLWNIQYMPVAETDWTNATTITGVTNPYTLTTLSASSTYKARVQTDCGTEQSDWSSAITFSTACDVITSFPWTEGFENTWVPAVFPGDKPAPNCWTVIDRGGAIDQWGENNDYWWERGTGTSSHTGSGHAVCYTDYGTTAHNDWLITPQIALTGNERLRFWAMRSSTSTGEPDEISVFISDEDAVLDTTGMGTYDTLANFTRIFHQDLPTGTWQQYEINLSQYSGNRYIAFVRQGTPDGYNLRLDDVEISELPSCMRPTNVIVSSITTTDAEVSWVNGSSADASWWIYYKQSTSTTYDSILVNSNPYVLTSLLPSSGYDIYVVTDCSTELSEASPIVNFRTLCDEISALPWSDNFDTYGTASGTFPPCWTRPVINNGNPKIVTANHSSPASLFFQSLTTVPTYAVTPAFTADLNTLMVSFWLKAEGVGSSQSGTITVGVMSNPNDTTTFEAVQLISPSTTDWIEYRIMLAGIQLQGSGNYIAFKHNSNANNWYYWLDDVEVDEIPACPNVYGLNAEPASTTSVSVNWNDEADQGDGYVIAYSSNLATSFDPTTATSITIPTGTTLPYVIPGFNPGDSVWVAVQRGCGGAWTDAVKVNLPEYAHSLPLIADFEDTSLDTVWTITNGTQTNKWYIGVPGANDSDPTDGIDERGLYISSDNGATATYSSASSIVFVSTLVEFDNSPAFELSFDWANNGEIDWHDLNVYLMPLSIALTPGTLPNSQYQINTASLAEETSFHTFTRVFDGSYSNSVKQLVFAWQNDEYGNYNPPARVDNISLVALSCGMPYNLAMDSASYNGTDVYLSWSDPQGATSWVVEYQQAGTTSWTQVLANTNPFTLTGLNSGTSYQARVYSLCNGTDTSAASNTISFQTPCLPLTVPTLLEEFNIVPPSTCWEKKTGLLPATGNASLSTTTSGWSLGSYGTPANARMNIYGTSARYWLISPTIDLGDPLSSSFAASQIEFDLFYTAYYSANPHNLGGTDDRFAVVISTDNGLTWNPTNAIIWSNAAGATRVLDSLTNVPTHVIIPLYDSVNSLPLSGLVKIAFYGESTVSNVDNDIHIDNFEVVPYATCQRPTNVQATLVTSTDATISFTENGASTSWEYVISTNNQNVDPNTLTPVVTSNPIQLTGLTAQTQYTVWVRSDCGTEYSNWSNSVTFITTPMPATVPYTCDFENSTEAFGWVRLSGGTNKWAYGTAAGNGPTTQNPNDSLAFYMSDDNGLSYSAPSSTVFAYAYRDIDFGTDTASYEITFDWKCQGHIVDNSVYHGLIVYFRDPAVPINVSGFPTDINNYVGLCHSQTTWQTITKSLDHAAGLQRLIFLYFDQGYGGVPPAAIDNISIIPAPCARPTNLVSGESTPSTIDISWVNGSSTDAAWWVYYRESTSTDWDSILATSNPFTIPNLLESTEYVIYVRTSCNPDVSLESNVIRATTSQTPATIPYTCDFEEAGTNGWLIKNGSCVNKWMVGTPTGGTSSALFVSNNNAGAIYGTSNYSVVIAERLIEFDASDSITLSFDLSVGGESSFDYLKVFLTHKDTVFSPSTSSTYFSTTSYASEIIMQNGTNNYINFISGPQTLTKTFANPGYGEKKKLVFVWKNDGSVGDGIAPVIDNISMLPVGSSCPPPTNLSTTIVQNTTATVTWVPAGDETSWQVRLGADGTPADISVTTYQFQNLTPGTQYTYYVRANCGGTYSGWVQGTFTTTEGHQPVLVTTVQPIVENQTTATFQATYVEGSEAVTAIGFEYRELSGAYIDLPMQTAIATPFTHQITTLTANTTYKVRAYAVTPTDGKTYGDTLEFTTPPIVPPTVHTQNAVVGTNNTSATFHGTIEQGSENVEARGFEYKKASDSWDDYDEISATGTSPITATVQNLQPNTSYEVRAYAKTTVKYYGEVQPFQTLSLAGLDGEDITVLMYPNPATDETKLVLTGINGEVKIIISDVQGRIINTIAVKSTNNKVEETIELGSLSKGVYYVRLQNDKLNRTQKLIVK